MKKVYIKPITHEVVLNIQEKLMWGELANPSNDITHPGAKQFNWFEDEKVVKTWEEDDDEVEETVASTNKPYNVWEDDL